MSTYCLPGLCHLLCSEQPCWLPQLRGEETDPKTLSHFPEVAKAATEELRPKPMLPAYVCSLLPGGIYILGTQ